MLTSLLMITCGWVILYPGIQCKCKVQLPVAKLMVCLVCYWKSVFMCKTINQTISEKLFDFGQWIFAKKPHDLNNL